MKADKTTSQVVSHNFGKNKMAILTIACFGAALLSSLLLYVSAVLAGILVTLFTVLTFICAFNIKDSAKTEELHVMENPIPLDGTKLLSKTPSKDEWKLYGIDGEESPGNPNESFAMSLLVNMEFVKNPIDLTIDPELYSFPEKMLSYVAYLKDNRDKELSRFSALKPDKTVMGLRSDLSLSSIADDKPVVLNNISRYAAQVTDDAFMTIVMNKKLVHDKVVYAGRSLCVDSDGALIPFSESGSANEIDIHCLVISSDGYVMFRRGTKAHPLFPGKVVSSASCSLRPDIVDPEAPLQESMILSLHRKLRSVYSLSEDVELISSSCGFARIMPRGGAPEFYVITRMDLTKDEIIKSHSDETAEFMEDLLMSMVPEIDTVDDAADYISRAIHSIRATVGNQMSISASALFSSIFESLADQKSSEKILQRIGVLDRPDDYQGRAVGGAVKKKES